MFANERRIQITEMLNRRSSVTVNELTHTFRVSLETIRRDLEYLEKQGALKRVHGGAVTVHKMRIIPAFPSVFQSTGRKKENLLWLPFPLFRRKTELPSIPVPPPLSWLPCCVSAFPDSPSSPIPWRYSRFYPAKKAFRPS